VKRISTNTIREPQGLRPARDAGLNVGARQRRKQKSPYPVMTIVVAAVGLAAIGWLLSWGTEPGAAEHATLAAAAKPVTVEERDPTPLFATEGDTQFHLPIDPTQLTALGYHQASGVAAMHFTSLAPDADMTAAAELKAVPPYEAPADLPPEIWGGTVLRLWRSGRGGQPDTAADVGADPGTPVWSPVTGTVVAVRPYLLYDKYEDVEVHIQPEGRDGVDVVLIHIQDVVVKAGDKVKGGVTRIASVRKMSDKIEIQLGGYVANGGDHVHVQMNLVEIPGDIPAADGS
jgi:murein DD-endopeptidase MepM/ murein hydrolase activator NlpD